MSATSTHDNLAPTTPLRRIAAASFVGTTIEWYDFFIFLTAASLVFNEVFFPGVSPLIGVMLGFLTHGIGFVVRPLGATLFGHLGDRIGRKSTLVITLLSMGVSTFAIGLLPAHDTGGNVSALLLVLMRIVQGLAVGGEWGGAVLIATENAQPNQKVFYGSFAQLGSPGGLLFATLAFTAVTSSFSPAELVDWAWRIPFLASALLIPVGLIIRLRIAETPEFRRAVERHETSRLPIVTVFRRQGLQVLTGTFAFAGVFLTYYLLTSFVLSYATETLGMSNALALPTNIIAAVVEGVFIFVGVLLAKRYTARLVAAWSAVGLLVWSGPAFAMMHTREAFMLYVAVAVAMTFVGASYGVLAGEVAELFTPAVRYSGTSLCYHFAGAIGGGLGPITATWLLSAVHSSWPVALLSAVGAGVMTVACLALPRPGAGNAG
ncbi:MAG: MFS transporter [Micromonosporaceae bacterium]